MITDPWKKSFSRAARRSRPARPGGQPWRRRTFLSGQAVSLLGDGLAALAIPLLVLDLSRSPLISALSAASVTVGYLMVGLPAGVLVDRVDPWRVLVLTDALSAGLFAALFGFASAGALAVWLVLVISLAAGACSVFSQTALAVVVRDLFPAAGLIRANSILELASQLSLVAGPAVVGALAAVGSINLALLADAITFAVSLLSLLAVGRWRPGRAAAPAARRGGPRWRGVGADLRAGLRYVASVRVLVILTAVQMVVNLCLAAEKLIVFYARGHARAHAVPRRGGGGGGRRGRGGRRAHRLPPGRLDRRDPPDSDRHRGGRRRHGRDERGRVGAVPDGGELRLCGGGGGGEPGEPHPAPADRPAGDAGPGHQRGPGALPGRGPDRGGARRHGDVGAGRRPAAGVPGGGDRHRGGGGGLADRAPEGRPGR
jgi:hypothetical protein